MLGRRLVVAEAVLDEDADDVAEVGQRRLVGRAPGPAVRKFPNGRIDKEFRQIRQRQGLYQGSSGLAALPGESRGNDRKAKRPLIPFEIK